MTAMSDLAGSWQIRGISRAAVVIAAFWALAVLPAALLPMTDPDTFWHIRAGLDVLEHGRVPTIDEWSIAGAGRLWVSQDWLSNVVMAVGFQAGQLGPTVLSIVYGLLATAAIAILWIAMDLRRTQVGWLGKVGWLLFGLVLAAPVLGARVQVVDLLLASTVLWLLWRYLRHRRPAELLALPALAALWVNLHAGFPLLFLFGGAVIAGEALDRLLARRPEEDPLGWLQMGWLLVALAAAGAALLLNPNGASIYAYPFDTIRMRSLASFVGEWQAATLDTPAGQLLAIFVVVGVLPALLVSWRRMRSADAFILLGLVLMSVLAVRFLLVTGPIGATLVCLALAPWAAATRIGTAAANFTSGWTHPDTGVRGALNGALWVAIVVAGLTLVGWRARPAAQEAGIAERYPVDAVNWLRSSEGEHRLFNRYEWGGYLGLMLPGRPVFIDGRADVYGDSIILEYVDTISVATDPQATFDRYGIDRVLYPADSTLGRWLDGQAEWSRAYDGNVGAIWMKRDD